MIDWNSIGAQVAHWCAIIGGSISIPAVIGYLATSRNRIKLQNFITKTTISNEAVIADAADKAVNKAVGKLKTITFKHDIEPIVVEKLQEGIEAINHKNEEKLNRIETQNKHIVDLFETFAAYFDGSYYIDDEKKDKCREALEIAKADYYEQELAESVIDDQIVEPEQNTENNNQNEGQDTTSIIR